LGAAARMSAWVIRGHSLASVRCPLSAKADNRSGLSGRERRKVVGVGDAPAVV
jgi:hypothetical protein